MCACVYIQALNGIIGAAFGAAGQRCMAISVAVFVGMHWRFTFRVYVLGFPYALWHFTFRVEVFRVGFWQCKAAE